MRAKEYLIRQLEKLSDQKLRLLCEKVIYDKEFNEIPASTSFHHTYPGGCFIHVAEVMQNALAIASSEGINKVDLDVLIVSVIFHDYMKIREYGRQSSTETFRDHLYHISAGYSYWEKAATAAELNSNYIEKVSHCILSHHGRKEWGSPIEPKTLEAQILHQADFLSAWFGKNKDFNNEVF